MDSKHLYDKYMLRPQLKKKASHFSFGFTLIELLVVIAILGILVAITILAYSGSQGKARDARRKADLRSIQVALEQYYNDYKRYPITGVGVWVYSSASAPWISDAGSGIPIPFGSPYMNSVPVDPENGQSVAPADANYGSYVYSYYSANGQGYILVAHLENTTDPQAPASLKSVPYGNTTYGGWPFANNLGGLYSVSNP